MSKGHPLAMEWDGIKGSNPASLTAVSNCLPLQLLFPGGKKSVHQNKDESSNSEGPPDMWGSYLWSPLTVQ